MLRFAATALALFVVLLFGRLEAMSFSECGILGLLYVTSGLAGLVLLVAGVCKRRSDLGLRGIGLACVVLVSHVVGGAIENSQVNASRRRGDAICGALEAYRTRVGTYPASLSLLVPTDSPRIPSTAMGVIRSFDFHYEILPDGGFHLAFTEPATWTGWRRGPTGPWTWYD